MLEKVNAMSIQIGDNNTISNSTISERIETDKESKKKRSFYEKHPIICGFLISLVAGFVLLFSFWGKIISFLEGLL